MEGKLYIKNGDRSYGADGIRKNNHIENGKKFQKFPTIANRFSPNLIFLFLGLRIPCHQLLSVPQPNFLS